MFFYGTYFIIYGMRRKSYTRFFVISTLLLGFAVPQTTAATYRFTEKESEVAFKLTHLGITTADGKFERFEGFFDFDTEKHEAKKVRLAIQSGSVTSENKGIADLMRSDKFFAADKFPFITFTSNKVERVSPNLFHIHGDLSIRGRSNPAVFETELVSKGEEGKRLFFLSHTFISRKDYGIGVKDWRNPFMILMHEALKITLQVEGIPVEKV